MSNKRPVRTLLEVRQGWKTRRNPHGSWPRWTNMRAIFSAMQRGLSVTSNAHVKSFKKHFSVSAEQPARVESHLAQWLFTVCRNLAFDVRKKENRMSPLKDPETIPITYDRPGASLEHEQTMSQVLRLMDTLPKNQREVLRLKFQSDLSYKEISEITKLSITNV